MVYSVTTATICVGFEEFILSLGVKTKQKDYCPQHKQLIPDSSKSSLDDHPKANCWTKLVNSLLWGKIGKRSFKIINNWKCCRQLSNIKCELIEPTKTIYAMKNLKTYPVNYKKAISLICLIGLSLFPFSAFAQYTLTSSDVTFSNGVITAYTNTTQTDIIIPDNFGGVAVIGIGSNAFQNKSLTSVLIANTITSIGSSAFSGCTGLTSFTIPSSITSIGSSAFYGCTKLATVNYNAPNCTFGNYAVFDGCTALTQINLGGNITKIPDYAFEKCTGLTSITIPTSVTSIGYQSFAECTGLTSFTIPSSITSIGIEAFSGCTGLTIIDVKKTTPINLSSVSDVFYNVNKSTCVLYVPIGSVNLYATATQWKDFTNIKENTQKGFYRITPDSTISNVKYTDIKILAYPIDSTTKIKLLSANDTISPDSILSRSNTTISARFTWKGKKGGVYDVYVISEKDTLINEKGFTLIKVTDAEEPFDTDSDGYRDVSKFANLVWIFENDSSHSLKYKLDNDIDASESSQWYYGKGFNPITNFSGIIDGQEHSIRYLTFNRTTQDSIAFISKLSNEGVIRNLVLTNCNIKGKNYVAGLVACNNGTISNSSCTGTVSGNNNVGGVTSINNGTIKCSYNSSLITGNDYVGGLAGNSTSSSIISKSYNQGKVIGKDINIAGIVAQNRGKITNCYNVGSIIGSGEVAGIAGWNYGDISNVYNVGFISGAGNAVGAIIGINSGSSLVNSFSDREKSGGITSQYGVNGTQKTTLEMKTQSTYTNWDFTNTWEIMPTMNDGYPQLNWSTNPKRIRSYSPDKVANVDSCSITFEGSGFDKYTRAFLSKTGQDAIKADTLIYSETYCIARFNLKNKVVGSWNIIVQYPDTTINIQNGLTIEAKKEGELKIEILGADKFRKGRTSSVNIRITNTGNSVIKEPLVYISIASDDTTFTAYSNNSLIPDELKNRFDSLDLNPYDYSFIKVGKALDGYHNLCKMGIFVFPTLEAFESIDFPIEIKSQENISILAWQEKDISIGDFFQTLDVKSVTRSGVMKSESLNYSCLSSLGSCICQSISSSYPPPYNILFGTAVSGFFYSIDQTASAKGLRPESTVKDMNMLLCGTIVSAIYVAGLSTGASEVATAALVASNVMLFAQCSSSLYSCIPDNVKQFVIKAVSSFDPNDKIGYRSPSGSTYFNDNKTNFTYVISFENKETASAPAQEVTVIDTLDLKLFNIESFKTGYIKIGNNTYSVPLNVQDNKWTIDMRPEKNLITYVTLNLDKQSGIAKWYFRCVDPATMEFPVDATEGFLPPNDNTGRGEGSVMFTINLKDSTTDDASIKNKAQIVFDYNEPIYTPTWTNTKDIIAPTSSMNQPSIVSDSIARLSWKGSDNKGGSGVFTYNVYMKKSNEAYSTLLTNTAQSSMDFKYKTGIEYSFYVTATDSAGNAETKTTVPDITLLQQRTGINGISDSGKNSMTVYPNPSSKNQGVKVSISIESLKYKELVISTVYGSIVKTIPFAGNELEVKGLNNGMYIFTLRVDNRNIISRKVVITQ